jgi:hypothetical protein
MNTNRYQPPVAELRDVPKAGRSIRARVLSLTGCAIALYWGWHFLWHLQHWTLYSKQATNNPMLGPAFRSAVDLSAVLAGMLMAVNSTWLVVPFIVHCVAFTTMILSISRVLVWAAYPVDMRVTWLAQLFVVGLIVWGRRTLVGPHQLGVPSPACGRGSG